jgi:hypothetical protein
MKLPIIIEFNSGESETYMAQPPEWAKWEKATGKTISQAQDSIGMWDLMFFAYHSMKRQAGGKPIKAFDVWMENVSNVTVGDIDSPKAMNTEA